MKSLCQSALWPLLLVFGLLCSHALPAQRSARSSETAIRFDAFTGQFASEWRVAGGIGLLSTFFKDRGRNLSLPLQFRFGYRFVPAFSLDAMIGLSETENTLPYYQAREPIPCENRFRLLALRPTGHLRINYRSEAYGGLLLAYQDNHITPLHLPGKGERNPSIRPAQGLFLSAFIGTRYLFTPTIGVFGELGMGVSLATVGVSARLVGR